MKSETARRELRAVESAHPRTGQPIENPYIKVKANAMNQLRKITTLRNVAALWE